ncbi:hypothetical protein AB0K00_55705 [Dactylosporangium sp. NPDC049525]|uniref:hypothetical protein n=1 Tax=Dactylosporangium sp. NPDC049525 TaxID=3154730 RepID=UPI0034122C2A
MTVRSGELARVGRCTRCGTWWLWLPWPGAEAVRDDGGCPECLPGEDHPGSDPGDRLPGQGPEARSPDPDPAGAPPAPAAPPAVSPPPPAISPEPSSPPEPTSSLPEPLIGAGTQVLGRDRDTASGGTDPAPQPAIRIVYPPEESRSAPNSLSVKLRVVEHESRELPKLAEFIERVESEAPAPAAVALAAPSSEHLEALQRKLVEAGAYPDPAPEPSAWGRWGCEVLAQIADILDAARSWVARAAGRTVEIILGGTGEPGRIVRLIGRFVEQTVKAGLKPVSNVANALRVAGVVLCAVDGVDLTECRCGRGLFDSIRHQAVVGDLAALINEILDIDASSSDQAVADRRRTGIVIEVVRDYMHDWFYGRARIPEPNVPPPHHAPPGRQDAQSGRARADEPFVAPTAPPRTAPGPRHAASGEATHGGPYPHPATAPPGPATRATGPQPRPSNVRPGAAHVAEPAATPAAAATQPPAATTPQPAAAAAAQAPTAHPTSHRAPTPEARPSMHRGIPTAGHAPVRPTETRSESAPPPPPGATQRPVDRVAGEALPPSQPVTPAQPAVDRTSDPGQLPAPPTCPTGQVPGRVPPVGPPTLTPLPPPTLTPMPPDERDSWVHWLTANSAPSVPDHAIAPPPVDVQPDPADHTGLGPVPQPAPERSQPRTTQPPQLPQPGGGAFDR